MPIGGSAPPFESLREKPDGVSVRLFSAWGEPCGTRTRPIRAVPHAVTATDADTAKRWALNAAIRRANSAMARNAPISPRRMPVSTGRRTGDDASI